MSQTCTSSHSAPLAWQAQGSNSEVVALAWNSAPGNTEPFLPRDGASVDRQHCPQTFGDTFNWLQGHQRERSFLSTFLHSGVHLLQVGPQDAGPASTLAEKLPEQMEMPPQGTTWSLQGEQ